MTVILVLCLLACSVWVISLLRRRSSNRQPRQSVEGFHRALEAIDPEPQQVRRR